MVGALVLNLTVHVWFLVVTLLACRTFHAGGQNFVNACYASLL